MNNPTNEPYKVGIDYFTVPRRCWQDGRLTLATCNDRSLLACAAYHQAVAGKRQFILDRFSNLNYNLTMSNRSIPILPWLESGSATSGCTLWTVTPERRFFTRLG